MFKRNENPMVDVQKGLNIANVRREAIDNSPSTPLPKTYKVNELAKALHPGYISAELIKVENCTYNSKVLTFKSLSENKRFPYFKAGEFITVSSKIGESIVTRPYSIFSSPLEALDGIIRICVQDAGFFSHYLCNEIMVGTKVIIGEASGDFYYDNLRDNKNIVGIAGGSGVTPFVSMILSILEGSDDFNLTLFYGVRKRENIMYDFSKINDNRIKVITVLSDELVDGYEHGFITSELLKKYLPSSYSVFMCGPDKMYEFVSGEFNKLGIDNNRIRTEHNCIGDLSNIDVIKYTIKVHLRDKTYDIPAFSNETILTAMEKAGLYVPSKCRSGFCGLCHSRLISGDYYTSKEHDHRRLADYKFGYIHPCSTYPRSDMEIDVPPLDILKEL